MRSNYFSTQIWDARYNWSAKASREELVLQLRHLGCTSTYLWSYDEAKTLIMPTPTMKEYKLLNKHTIKWIEMIQQARSGEDLKKVHDN